jgi:Resolvase, N terminal domain
VARAICGLAIRSCSRSFNVVVAEALDRLSRDQEHIAALFKHLSFAGVKIITLAKGEIGALHVGLKGKSDQTLTGFAPLPNLS